MANIFLISDTHFGHRSAVLWTREDGSKIRDFETVEAMDEHMVERWNATVHPKDIVYHLGDFVMNRRALPIAARLNGRKKLVRGNHDAFKAAEFAEYFEDQMGVKEYDMFIFSHMPVHPTQFPRYAGNIHGHLHDVSLPDPRYLCVSVEQINYTPVPYETVKKQFFERIENADQN